IVTGVFVDSAMQVNKSDAEIVIHEDNESKKDYMESMHKLFQEMDVDSSGTLSLAEFDKSLQDERVRSYFKCALNLDIGAARGIFTILTHEKSDEISISEFVHGCYALQGEAKHLDTKITQCHVEKLQGDMKDLLQLVKNHVLTT
ncbi:unnamed protein product, partial [Polarella glacialis]